MTTRNIQIIQVFIAFFTILSTVYVINQAVISTPTYHRQLLQLLCVSNSTTVSNKTSSYIGNSISQIFDFNNSIDILMNSTENNVLGSFFKRNESLNRPSSFPYMTGDTLRQFADHIFDDTRPLTTWSHTITLIKDGDIVFLEPHLAQNFFPLFDKTNSSFVLITHNSDYSAPGPFKSYLESRKILAWFASNPDHDHAKLHPIPIGFANAHWGHGNMTLITTAHKSLRKPYFARKNSLYLNFATWTNTNARGNLEAHFKNFPGVLIRIGRVPFWTYLNDLGDSKFVLSPRGNGLDCHRTWEAFLMGAVPIVMKSTLDPLFRKTQAFLVDTWHNVTEKTLDRLASNQTDVPVPKVLLAKFWFLQLVAYSSKRGKYCDAI